MTIAELRKAADVLVGVRFTEPLGESAWREIHCGLSASTEDIAVQVRAALLSACHALPKLLDVADVVKEMTDSGCTCPDCLILRAAIRDLEEGK